MASWLAEAEVCSSGQRELTPGGAEGARYEINSQHTENQRVSEGAKGDHAPGSQ